MKKSVKSKKFSKKESKKVVVSASKVKRGKDGRFVSSKKKKK